MPTFSGQCDSQRCRSRDSCNYSDWNSALSQQWPLLNMELNKCRICSFETFDLAEFHCKSRFRSEFLECKAVGISKTRCRRRRQHSRHHPAAQAANAKSSRLFGSKYYKFDGSHGLEAARFQSDDSGQASKH